MVAGIAADMEVHIVADIFANIVTNLARRRRVPNLAGRRKTVANLGRGACKKEEEERVPNLVRELVTGVG